MTQMERAGNSDKWLPIETAPKDGSLVLLGWTDDRRPGIGRWEEEKYHQKPRPYWQHDRTRVWGVAESRKNPPTNWMPLPAPPEINDAQ